MRVVIAGLTLALSGCVSAPAPSPSYDEALLDTYLRCITAKAYQASKQRGDPLSLGIAVEPRCAGYRLAVTNQVNERRGPGAAIEMRRTLIEEGSRLAASVIVKSRSG